MFYCEECRIKKGWPKSIVGSYGRCEICGKVAECYDRPSKSLPATPDREIARQLREE
ncbi:hypothetical protein KAS31_03765 [Candidatus Parcubacteria bacterium]|nr:hypothetical protein [Candidatus Parcubacteria bacterium]